MSHEPIVRKRTVRSRRRRDGLIRCAKDVTSQNGEDGIIERIFELLPTSPVRKRWCVDVGAWDGKHLSNTYSLLAAKNESNRWKGVLIEADLEKFNQLAALHEPYENTCVNVVIDCVEDSRSGLCNILTKHGLPAGLPKDFDFLCVDIDGSDYWVLLDTLKNSSFRPKVICVEFNPTMPDDLIYIPAKDDNVRHGASLAALVECTEIHSYVLVETTIYNAFFVDADLYEAHLRDEVPDTSIEALHEITMGTSLYQLYDGTIKLWGCRKMLWHRVPMDELKMQVLPVERRHFPFAPGPSKFDNSIVIDMSPYCKKGENALAIDRAACASLLLERLRKDGFCCVRGTGISPELCREAMYRTNSFLEDADESVRRYCLTRDRARRGYNPINGENFASLIGEKGPNDLVRKFRIGPTSVDTASSSLLQPNIWPTAEVWDQGSAAAFRSTIEDYYDAANAAAIAVVRAICDGLVSTDPDIEPSLLPLVQTDGASHSSILTLLSYRLGSRHKGKNKGPLVAAHTDVGVATFLLFDDGDCATLQRSDGKGGWMDVVLPAQVPEDPVFVLNIADFFAAVSNGSLPSTLHRVVTKTGKKPRNCCALFVGLDPGAQVVIADETMSYEEWRRRRIAKAQNALRSCT